MSMYPPAFERSWWTGSRIATVVVFIAFVVAALIILGTQNRMSRYVFGPSTKVVDAKPVPPAKDGGKPGDNPKPAIVITNADGTTIKVNADEYDIAAEAIRNKERAADKAENDKKLAEQASKYEAAMAEQRKMIVAIASQKYIVDPNSAGASRRGKDQGVYVPPPQSQRQEPAGPTVAERFGPTESPQIPATQPIERVVRQDPPAPPPMVDRRIRPETKPWPEHPKVRKSFNVVGAANAAVPMRRHQAPLVPLNWDEMAYEDKIVLVKLVRKSHCRHRALPENLNEDAVAAYIAFKQNRKQVIEGLAKECGVRVSEPSYDDEDVRPRQLVSSSGDCGRLPGTHWSNAVQSCVPNR